MTVTGAQPVVQEQRGQQHCEYGLYAIDNGVIDRRGEVQADE